MNPQYLNYNPCTVKLNKEVIITNIQDRGLPSKDCGAHLESLSIKETSIGQGNETALGASGSISLIDYKNAVFDVLRSRLKDFIQTNKNNSYMPTVQIIIDCFTGKRIWYGWVTNWSYSFVGTTPSITLEWSALPPNDNTQPVPEPTGPKVYHTPKELIDAANVSYKSVVTFKIVDADGNDVSSKLEFKSGEVNFDLNGIKSSGSNLKDCYDFVINNSTIDGKPLIGTIKTKDDGTESTYIVKFANPENNTGTASEGAVTNSVVFVQNGSLPYYKPRADGKYVIPMSSFNFSTQPGNMVLQSRVMNNVNGNVELNTNNGENKVSLPDANNSANNSGDAGTSPSGVTVTFDCYNVLSFSSNNITEPVYYEVYDEFGNTHVASGQGTVSEVNYSLDGGVVKASVTAVEFFNSAITQVTGSSVGGSSDGGSSSGGSKKVKGRSKVKSTSMNSVISSDEESYFRREDETYVDLSYDSTSELVKSGIFNEQVTEFFDRGYADLTGTSRMLDLDYIESLFSSGNIALLTLLVGVANYGIKNGSSIFGTDDPVKHTSIFNSLSPWQASSIGKKPYDYTQGGLGIPHWDSGNFKTIYQAVGFDPKVKNDRAFMELLTKVTDPPTVANPKDVKKGKPAKYYTGKVTSFRDGEFCGIPRVFPVLGGGGSCFWRRFDDGLKSNKTWTDWAYSILHGKNSSGDMIYQAYLFRLWVTKFWEPTIQALKEEPAMGVRGDHRVCLQDAVRIARMGNSATNLIDKAAGFNVSTQLDVYNSHYPDKPEHVIKQWAFCKRCAYMLEKLVTNP